jgi:hypothetical protein
MREAPRATSVWGTVHVPIHKLYLYMGMFLLILIQAFDLRLLWLHVFTDELFPTKFTRLKFLLQAEFNLLAHMICRPHPVFLLLILLEPAGQQLVH